MDVKNTNREFVFLIDSFFPIMERKLFELEDWEMPYCGWTSVAETNHTFWGRGKPCRKVVSDLVPALLQCLEMWISPFLWSFSSSWHTTGLALMLKVGLNMWTHLFHWEMINYIWVVNEQGLEGWYCPICGQDVQAPEDLSFFFF